MRRGQVNAKTGTFVAGSASGLVLKAQALAGYIKTKSGRKLAYELVVNNVAITGLKDVIQVFQDEGTIIGYPMAGLLIGRPPNPVLECQSGHLA